VKPLLVFDGNCQAQHLAAMLRSTGVADTAYVGPDWGFLPAHKGCIARLIPKEREEDELAAAKAAGAAVIQVSQLSPFSKSSRAKGALPSADRRVFFPELRQWAISPRQFASRFKAGYDVKRILELDLQSMRFAYEKSEFPIDVPGFVEREFAQRPLFHTINHPAGAVFSRLLEGLAVLLRDDLDPEVLTSLAAEVESREGLNFETDHPLPPTLRQELGLAWPSTYDRYARMLSAREDEDWEALEEGRAEFESLFAEDTQFWRAYALLGIARNDAAVAEPALERLLELCPGVRAPWMLYGQFLRRNGRKDEIPALLSRAHRLFGDCGIWHGIAARLNLMLDALPVAEGHARQHWAASMDNINSAFPLIEILLRQNRKGEAEDFIRSLETRPPLELAVLRGFLARKARDLLSLVPA
jgi:hypothetical protein